MTSGSNDASNEAPNSALSLPAELRIQIHKYLNVDVATNGGMYQYKGYMLSSKQTYREVSSIILENLNKTLVAVENGYQEHTGAILQIDKPTTLHEAKHITVGLPKSLICKKIFAMELQPYDQNPLLPLFDIHCSSLVFHLYDDPAWLSLAQSEAFAQHSSVQTMVFKISLICRWISELASTRKNVSNPVYQDGLIWPTINWDPTTPDDHGLVNASTLVFEWGSLMGPQDWQVQQERFFIGSCFPEAKRSDSWWRHMIYRANGTTHDISGANHPERFIEPVKEGRVPTIGIVLDKIESRDIIDRVDSPYRPSPADAARLDLGLPQIRTTARFRNVVYSKDVH